jgi:hypothetical protein
VTIAIRPSEERNGTNETTDLGIFESGIFFATDLDDPNHVEIARKISFLAQASNPSFMPSNRGVRQGIALTVNLMAVDPTPENISPFQAVC